MIEPEQKSKHHTDMYDTQATLPILQSLTSGVGYRT